MSRAPEVTRSSGATGIAGFSPYGAPEPRIAPDADPLLADLCRIASAAVDAAWRDHPRDALSAVVAQGADGTPSYLIDELVEAPIVAACERVGVNVLSEEIGFLDRGSARTVVVDPLDGSANAASGVPLSCFSAALLHDDRPVSALTCWLENGATVSATAGVPSSIRTTGRTRLDGAAVGLLRPKRGERGESARGWWAIADRAARVRILSSSCLEAMLVAQGSIDAFADAGSDTHRIVDLAAAMVIVESAGGAVRDVYGRPLTFEPDLGRRWSGVVASTGDLADEIARLVADVLPDVLGTWESGGSSYELRRARREDVPAIRDLLAADAMSSGHGGVDDENGWSEVFARIDARPGEWLLVATDPRGAAAATVQLTVLDGLGYGGLRHVRLEGLAVRVDLRGAGLGGQLLDWATAWARAQGAGAITLTSNLRRERAIAFYDRHGFEFTHAGLRLVL